MPTHLDFICHVCGATATRVRTLDAVLACDAHRSSIAPYDVELRGIDRDLWNHTLEVIEETERVQLYRLVDPRCGGEMQSMRLAFLPSYIAIHGDWCPGRETQDNRGVFSDHGYTRSWFVGATSESYLCGKFIGRVFVPARAAAYCRDLIEQEWRDGKHDEELRELADDADSLDERGDGEIESWKERLYALTEDSECFDACYDYDPTNAALLCAIQRRFRFLWLAHEAERIAREETARAHAAGVADAALQAAQKLMGGVCRVVFDFEVKGTVAPPLGATLPDLIDALRLDEAQPNEEHVDADGKRHTSIRARPDPRLIAAVYALEHYSSEPAGQPGPPIVVLPDSEHPDKVKALFVIRFPAPGTKVRPEDCEHENYKSGGLGKPDICDDCGTEL